MAERLTFLRVEIWRRLGALGTVGKVTTEINREIRALPLYKTIEVAGNTKCQVVNDTVINIIMYKTKKENTKSTQRQSL